jgi:lipopolysaccharide/colanic/teichoic acid biosynthesis glycosyltransferase
MATQKPALLPWKQKEPYEDDFANSFERRLQLALIQEAAFVQMLRFERRRTERSGKQFMLVLISSEDFHGESSGMLISHLASAISSTTRETDVLGWYESGVTLGLLMTEIGEPKPMTVDIIAQKVQRAIQNEVTIEEFRAISFQFRLFPQEVERSSSNDDNYIHFPDITRQNMSKHKGEPVLKRTVDIIGSLTALLLFMPIFLIVAVLVKLTSRGPTLFCQKRVGLYGKEFQFYKFRTMYTDNDPEIHQEYVAKLIAGDISRSTGIYKLVNDPRITPLGRFLRKTSLDELPQFFNVLKNDMSLVGPRPPLPYEFERYQTWHKRRVLELKPGLTGLWQVEGRSRTTFDEMVRMDLRYAFQQSFWFDLKILLQTPSAMFSGRGAC